MGVEGVILDKIDGRRNIRELRETWILGQHVSKKMVRLPALLQPGMKGGGKTEGESRW